MKRMQLFLLSLILPVFMGYASGCKPAVGCKPLCKNRDGSLDITFGDHGTILTDVGGSDDSAQGIAVLPCGRIVAAGYSNSLEDDSYDFALAGYTSYGILDTKFGPDGTGIVLTDFATVLNSVGGSFVVPSNDQAFAVALQKNCDGCDYVCGDDCYFDCNRNCKLVVVGGSDVMGGGSQIAVARYNADGSLDTTFGFNNSGVQVIVVGQLSIAQAVAIQEDNKIIVAGFAVTGTNADFVVVRFNCDGSLDTTFGCNENGIIITDFGGFNDLAYAVKIQKDGKIVLAGKSISTEEDFFALARYHSNGRLDRSFGPDHNGKVVTAFPGSVEGAPVALVLLEDCGLGCGCDDSFRIVAISPVVAIGEDTSVTKIALAGYTAHGCLDKNFGSSGTGLVTTTFIDGSDVFASAAAVQRGCGKECKIVVAGSQASQLGSSNTFMLARYDANGILDNTFGSDGKVAMVIRQNSQAFAVALQDNGDIVAAGRSDLLSNDFVLARYNQCEPCNCLCVKSDCASC